ncbi:hypothetical protein GX48_02385 [Paracoccidioides brasiliensis]|nr:hypothetical protein GX48_02385 [Paracoccidioides brasiliensis]
MSRGTKESTWATPDAVEPQKKRPSECAGSEPGEVTTVCLLYLEKDGQDLPNFAVLTEKDHEITNSKARPSSSSKVGTSLSVTLPDHIDFRIRKRINQTIGEMKGNEEWGHPRTQLVKHETKRKGSKMTAQWISENLDVRHGKGDFLKPISQPKPEEGEDPNGWNLESNPSGMG